MISHNRALTKRTTAGPPDTSTWAPAACTFTETNVDRGSYVRCIASRSADPPHCATMSIRRISTVLSLAAALAGCHSSKPAVILPPPPLSDSAAAGLRWVEGHAVALQPV